MHEIGAIVRADTETHLHLRERIVAITLVTLVVDLVCTVLIWLFERHAAGTDVKSIGSAMFFSSTQLLTVSSSMTNPLTTAGRVLDVLMEVYAITVVASLAGMFGAFFHRRSDERRGAAGEAPGRAGGAGAGVTHAARFCALWGQTGVGLRAVAVGAGRVATGVGIATMGCHHRPEPTPRREACGNRRPHSDH